jgi:hypothetical protein
MADDNQTVGEFGASFMEFLGQMAAHGSSVEAPLAKRLREHFGVAATELPIIEEKFGWSERPNLQIAFDTYLGKPMMASPKATVVAR